MSRAELEQRWEQWKAKYLAGLPVGDEFPFARELIEARKHSTMKGERWQDSE